MFKVPEWDQAAQLHILLQRSLQVKGAEEKNAFLLGRVRTEGNKDLRATALTALFVRQDKYDGGGPRMDL